MQDMLAIWGLFFRYAIGLSVFALLMTFALRAISQPWRKVAEPYAGQPDSRRFSRRFPETVVITGRVEGAGARGGRNGWHVYAAVRMDMHEDCLMLSMIFPFNLMCAPLLLPVSEMQLEETWWLTLPDPVAIRMKRAPDVDMIIRGSAAGWLRDAMATATESVDFARATHTLAV